MKKESYYRERFRHDYLNAQADKTLTLGKIFVFLGVPLLAYFIYQDHFILKMPVLTYLRFILIIPFLIFSISVFTILPKRKNLIVFFHAALLISVNVSILSVIYYFTISEPHYISGFQEVILSYIVCLFFIYLFSGITKKFFSIIVAMPFLAVAVSIIINKTATNYTLLYHLINPALLIVVLLLISIFNEKYNFNQFVKLKLYEERNEQIKEELKNKTELFNELQNVFDENRSISEDLLNEIMYDSLTGAFNRNPGHKKLISDIEFMKSTDGILTICYIDVDSLKHYNDTYGHESGDDFLKIVVSSIKKYISPSDYILRVGGDEFIIVFVNSSIDFAKEKIEEIKVYLKNQADDDGLYDFSTGFAQLGAHDDVSIEQLVSEADKNMYLEKQEKKVKVLRI